VMQMAKDRNALACSRAFDYVTSLPGDKKILMMMNNVSDDKKWSENVCWLYDCDFEFLKRPGVTLVAATGPRALDYRLRLLIAGVPEENIVCSRDEVGAADKLNITAGDSVYILYGTDSVATAEKVRDRVLEIAREKEEKAV
ncbi:MAG: DUF1727 domain-containing protein, partial [Oscillospiraceae bacterium]|nr:DUF1727 domain-containing protein [Oscillospiraceae bacterium]